MTTAPLDDLAALLAPLHAPFTCKSLKAPNRFCMAPMSRYFAPGGVLSTEGAEYYRRRAAAGIGTIITEGTGVAIDHTVSADTVPIFAGNEPLAGWKGADRRRPCRGRDVRSAIVACRRLR